MKIYKVFITFILMSLCITQAYAYSCSDINKIVVNSKVKINESKLSDKGYIGKILHDAAYVDQQIRSNDFKQCKNISAAIDEIDKNNTIILNKVIDTHHWFPISQFGEDLASDAWLIVQHSQDLALQHKVLFIMERLIEMNEANKEQYALLYDRVALNYVDLGIKQKYGTQFEIHNNLVSIQPYEGTIANIEERRKQFGMQPLHEYEKILKSVFMAG